MGGCLNIEIHQKLSSNEQFISSLIDILKPGLEKEDLIKFVSSVKLAYEENYSWYEYEKVKAKYGPKESVEHLEWDVYLYCNQNEYKYVLELSILETEIQVHDEEWPCFDTEKIKQVLNLMRRFHRLNEDALILFTDEASQGKFVENLEVAKVDINYLFDLAILPKSLRWSPSNGKYEKIETIRQSEIWKNHSRYMSKFENGNLS